MRKPDVPRAGDAVTTLLLTVSRLNGALLTVGDRLFGDLGLTSARRQLLEAVATSPVPLPVASIARNLGVTRQAVRNVANDLTAAGLVRFVPNPHHRSAHLVVLTAEGERVHRAAAARRIRWARQLGRGMSPARVADATALLHAVLARLQERAAPGGERG